MRESRQISFSSLLHHLLHHLLYPLAFKLVYFGCEEDVCQLERCEDKMWVVAVDGVEEIHRCGNFVLLQVCVCHSHQHRAILCGSSQFQLGFGKISEHHILLEGGRGIWRGMREEEIQWERCMGMGEGDLTHSFFLVWVSDSSISSVDLSSEEITASTPRAALPV